MKSQVMKWLNLFVFILLFPSVGECAKLSLLLGGYSVEAKSSKQSGNISGIGNYNLSYEYPVFSSLDFALGYTVIMSEMIGGDMMFGPDIKFNYYPITASNPQSVSSKTLSISIEELWRFYLSIGFHQRQVQSVQVAYSGFSLGGGAEYALSTDVVLKGEARYLTMSGASDGEAKELSILVGIAKGFW